MPIFVSMIFQGCSQRCFKAVSLKVFKACFKGFSMVSGYIKGFSGSFKNVPSEPQGSIYFLDFCYSMLFILYLSSKTTGCFTRNEIKFLLISQPIKHLNRPYRFHIFYTMYRWLSFAQVWLTVTICMYEQLFVLTAGQCMWGFLQELIC